MSTGLVATVNLQFVGPSQTWAPEQPPTQVGASLGIAAGTSAGQVRQLMYNTQSVSGSSNATIDLRSFGNPAFTVGGTLTAAELFAIEIKVPDDASGTITIEPGASNGYTGIGGASLAMVLNPGDVFLRTFQVGDDISSAYNVKLTNAGASATSVRIGLAVR